MFSLEHQFPLIIYIKAKEKKNSLYPVAFGGLCWTGANTRCWFGVLQLRNTREHQVQKFIEHWRDKMHFVGKWPFFPCAVCLLISLLSYHVNHISYHVYFHLFQQTFLPQLVRSLPGRRAFANGKLPGIPRLKTSNKSCWEGQESTRLTNQQRSPAKHQPPSNKIVTSLTKGETSAAPNPLTRSSCSLLMTIKKRKAIF